MPFGPQSLLKNFYLRNFIGISLSIFFVGSFWFISSYRQINNTTQLLKEKTVLEQREELKERVMHVTDMIEHEQRRLHDRIVARVRSRTHEAYAIMEAIYNKHRNRLSPEQIAAEIRNTLRVVRYAGTQGYYFATGLDGIEQLYPPQPELEGTNFLSLRDQHDKPVVQDMIRIARELGEGMYEYTWPKPNEPGRQFTKIAYIKYFAPLDWLVGTGEYVDETITQLQQQLLQRIQQIRFDNGGYIFAADYNGVSLTFPAKGRNMYEVRDKNGVKIVQELIRIARQGEGFLEYVMPPLDGEKNERKISFVTGIPAWQWYVGTGDFVANLDAEVSTMLEQRKADLIRSMILMAATLIVFLLASAYLSHRYNKKVLNSFKNFRDFFDKAAGNESRLDPEQQEFTEFRELAQAANIMVEKRQEAEAVLQAEEVKFRTLFEHVSDYILILEQHEKQVVITDLSETACRMHGYRREELLGQPLTVLDPETALVHAENENLQQLSAGKTVRLEATHRRKDESTFPIESLVKMVRDEKHDFLFAIERDLTEQKKLEKQQLELEEQVRQKYKLEAVGLMAGGMAHNFNNSLAIVLGNLEMAQRKRSRPEKVKVYLEGAQQAVLAARELVKQILLYSRKGEHKKKPLNLNRAVAETVKMLRSTTPTTLKLEILSLGRADDLNIYGDLGQIQEILLNLYTNAKHATDEEGTITFALEPVELGTADIPSHFNCAPGQYARLSVTDDGCGMTDEIQKKIFDPFFTTKEVDEGTGMGLSTVHGIVDQHGGLIKVSSRENSGTTFELYFPAFTQPPAAKQESCTAEEIATGSERILFVDDEPKISEIAEQMLSELGYDIVSVTSGKKALALILAEPHSYDLVITDQTMPEMTGKELAENIRSRVPSLPVILCSGYSSKISADKIGEYGISAYCHKPLYLIELSRTIRAVLDRRQETAE